MKKQNKVSGVTDKESCEWLLNRLIYLKTSMKDTFTVLRILRAKLTLVDINECCKCGKCDDCMSNDVEDAISGVRKEKRKEEYKKRTR